MYLENSCFSSPWVSEGCRCLSSQHFKCSAVLAQHQCLSPSSSSPSPFSDEEDVRGTLRFPRCVSVAGRGNSSTPNTSERPSPASRWVLRLTSLLCGFLHYLCPHGMWSVQGLGVTMRARATAQSCSIGSKHHVWALRIALKKKLHMDPLLAS